MSDLEDPKKTSGNELTDEVRRHRNEERASMEDDSRSMRAFGGGGKQKGAVLKLRAGRKAVKHLRQAHR